MSSLELVEVKPGCVFPVDQLRRILKSPRWVVRFAALKQLNAVELSSLLRLLFPDVDIVKALTSEGGTHSGHLQSYIVGLGYEHLLSDGAVKLDADPKPDKEDLLLADMLENLEVKVAEEIGQVADEITDAMAHMPGKEGRMQIRTLLKQDKRIKKRLGIAEPFIKHHRKPQNLVVFDDSGSMGEGTVKRVVAAVKALAVKADAHLVMVSNTARHWGPGEFTVEAALKEAQYGGTHYETLAPVFDRDWGMVITIADWDSSFGAYQALGRCTGRINTLLDISLVDRPTYLAECLGQLADEVKPLLVAKSSLTYDF